jgi:hypothetical protein
MGESLVAFARLYLYKGIGWWDGIFSDHLAPRNEAASDQKSPQLTSISDRKLHRDWL